MLLLLLSLFSRVWLCNPIDSSPPDSPIPGILQARTLEWVAISFSNAWKWKMKLKSLSHVWLLAISWTAAYQTPPSMGFSRQENCSGVPLPSPRCPLVRGFISGLSILFHWSIFLCASTTLSWWLWLCSRAWSQAGWFLPFHSSFSRLLWLFEVVHGLEESILWKWVYYPK